MRQISATDIKNFISAQDMTWVPMPDNITQSNDVGDTITSGNFAKVPFFIGTNVNDSTFLSHGKNLTEVVNMFLSIAAPDPTYQNLILDQYRSLGMSRFVRVRSIAS